MNIEPSRPRTMATNGAAEFRQEDVVERDLFHIDFGKLASILRRNVILISAIIVSTLALGLVITMLITPQYVAQASVQIDQQADRVLDSVDVEPVAAYQDVDRFLQTQTDVLRSRQMAIRVGQALNLFDNPGFLEAMNAAPSETGVRQSRADARENVLDIIGSNLTITLPRDSRLVEIAFRSPDAALAARIANSYATEFIRYNLERKFNSSEYARNFLSEQLGEAKGRLEESERAVNRYAREAGLIRTTASTPDGTSGPSQSVTTASLIQLNEAANEARAARIAAEQRWRTSAGAAALSSPEVLQNQAIQALLGQRATSTAALQQERAKHLDAHPTVQQLEAQVEEVNSQIQTLAASIRSSIKQQYDAALLREQSLANQVNALKGDTLTEQDRGVQYNILAREADTNRTLYDGLLQRYKEVSAAAGISTNNVSVVDEAVPPSDPSSPRLALNLALALLVGLLAAAAAVFAREQIDDSIRSPDDVEQKLDVPVLGVIPMPKTGVPAEHLEDPRSSVSEAYNALRTALLYSTPSGLPPLMLVTSSQAGEGKTTTSFAIATGLGKLGKRVVVVDVDLRRPALHQMFGLDNKFGLTDLLTQNVDYARALRSTDHEGLSFLSSGPIPPSPTELLGSTAMREVIDRLREQFDVIILDGPPVLGLADAPLLAALTSGTVFVIEANRGRRGGTKSAIRRLRAVQSNVVGAVLTKFDANKAGGAYGYYGYEYYHYGHSADEAASAGR